MCSSCVLGLQPQQPKMHFQIRMVLFAIAIVVLIPVLINCFNTDVASFKPETSDAKATLEATDDEPEAETFHLGTDIKFERFHIFKSHDLKTKKLDRDPILWNFFYYLFIVMFIVAAGFLLSFLTIGLCL